MAKDGTNRGGARAGAGRKKKALVDKVVEGRTDNLKVLPTPADLNGEVMPPIHEFMKAKQRGGKDLCAVAVYENVWKWLNEKGCAALVNPTLLQQYAMSVSRWIQCEEMTSKLGFLGKHPVSNKPIPSPFINIGIQYMNQANRLWNEIFQVVKENCSTDYNSAPSPQDDLMERLLRAREGR